MPDVILYSSAPAKLANAEIDWDSDTIKVALLASTYVPDQENHDYFDDVVADEIAATGGYTAGGATLASKTVTRSAARVNLFGAANVEYDPSTITARYAVYYDATPATDATRPLIGYLDFGADESSADTAFVLNHSTGIFTGTVAAAA